MAGNRVARARPSNTMALPVMPHISPMDDLLVRDLLAIGAAKTALGGVATSGLEPAPTFHVSARHGLRASNSPKWCMAWRRLIATRSATMTDLGKLMPNTRSVISE